MSIMHRMPALSPITRGALVVGAVFVAARPAAAQQLPTGVRLEPAGTSIDVGSLPLAMAISPDRRYAVLLLNGWR